MFKKSGIGSRDRGQIAKCLNIPEIFFKFFEGQKYKNNKIVFTKNMRIEAQWHIAMSTLWWWRKVKGNAPARIFSV